MTQLSAPQRRLVDDLASSLAAIDGVSAVVLGGSYARGRARTDSDIDLGVLYSESAPFSTAAIRRLAEQKNDTPDPVVTGFYEWGPWVNGGAWLTVGGQRIDLLYRSIEHLERVLADAHAGRYEIHWGQQPPFGFFSGTYLGEVRVCVPLHDARGVVASLKTRTVEYPDALRRAIVADCLWAVEFGLTAFAPKFASAGDSYGTAGCLVRFAHQLVMTLFALNRTYPVNDKTALVEVAEFPIAPKNFGLRVGATLGHLDASPGSLDAAVEMFAHLFRETAALSEGLYQPRCRLPE